MEKKTVFNIDFSLVSQGSDKYFLIEELEDSLFKQIVTKITDLNGISADYFSTDIIILFQKNLYLVVPSQKIIIKLDEIPCLVDLNVNKDNILSIYLLAIPWRYMILFGEIGLRKSYMEAGELGYRILNEVLVGMKVTDSDLIFLEEEISLGFENIEKQIVKKIEIIK